MRALEEALYMDDFAVIEVASELGPVVLVRGEVDQAHAPWLRERLEALDANIAVVDLTDVTFIDSAGLDTLIWAVNRMRANDGELRIVASHPNVLRVFEVTGLMNFFSPFNAREAAYWAQLPFDA